MPVTAVGEDGARAPGSGGPGALDETHCPVLLMGAAADWSGEKDGNDE